MGRDAAPKASFVSNVNSKCQKCLQSGHWTADCPNKPVYKSRPSRTALLKNPQLQSLPPVGESVEERMERERKEVLQQVLYQKEKVENDQHYSSPASSSSSSSSDTDFSTDEELMMGKK